MHSSGLTLHLLAIADTVTGEARYSRYVPPDYAAMICATLRVARADEINKVSTGGSLYTMSSLPPLGSLMVFW